MKIQNRVIFLPSSVVEDLNLSNGAFRCLCILIAYMNLQRGWNVTQRRIANMMNISKRTVNTYLRDLEDAELIDVERKPHSKSKYFLSQMLIETILDPEVT